MCPHSPLVAYGIRGGSAIRRFAFLSFTAVFIAATALTSTAEAAAPYTPVIIKSVPKNFIVHNYSPELVSIYFRQDLPEDVLTADYADFLKRIQVYVRVGGHFKRMRIYEMGSNVVSLPMLFPEDKLLEHIGAVQLKVRVDGVDSSVFSILVIAPPRQPPTIRDIEPPRFPVMKHVRDTEDTYFIMHATHLDTTKSTKVLVDGVPCFIGRIDRFGGMVGAYLPKRFLKSAGQHRVQVQNSAGISKPAYIMVGHFNIPSKGISHIGIKPQKPYSENKPSTMTTSRQHATSMPAPPPKPMRPSAMQRGARPKMAAANVQIVRETYRVDQSCRDMHRLIVFDVTVRNDGGPLASHQWSLFVMEGGGADLGSGGVWVPPLAPHAQANVSIPVLVLRSHIAQLPGTHWLKLVSTDNRTHKKTTTALRPITLNRGICQPQMRMQPALHAPSRLSPKLNPQPEPPSTKQRMQLPASRLTR